MARVDSCVCSIPGSLAAFAALWRRRPDTDPPRSARSVTRLTTRHQDELDTKLRQTSGLRFGVATTVVDWRVLSPGAVAP